MARALIVSFSVVPAPDHHGVQLTNLVRALASRHQVDCLTIRAGELAYVERFHKSRMLRVPVGDADSSAADRVQAFRRAVSRQLDGAEYDVVHVRDTVSAVPILERRAELGYRVVYEITGPVQPLAAGPRYDPNATLWQELADEEAALLPRRELVDLIIVPTRVGRERLIARGLGERVVHVPPGVDIDGFDWETRPSGPPLVLAAGRLAPTRGMAMLLKAFAAVLPAVPELRLMLVGGAAPGFVEQLGKAAGLLGIGKQIERREAVEHSDMPRIIARASVCVVTEGGGPGAWFAPAPMVLLEYLACRRPVLAPRSPAVDELVRDGDQALLFALGDVPELAAKLRSLVTDGRLSTRISDAGYASVRTRFPASAARRALLEAFARVLPPEHGLPGDRTPTPEMLPIEARGLPTRDPGPDARHPSDDGTALMDMSEVATATMPALRIPEMDTHVEIFQDPELTTQTFVAEAALLMSPPPMPDDSDSDDDEPVTEGPVRQ